MLLRLDLEESQVTAWILWWLAQGGGELLTTADICFGGQAAFGHSAQRLGLILAQVPKRQDIGVRCR